MHSGRMYIKLIYIHRFKEDVYYTDLYSWIQGGCILNGFIYTWIQGGCIVNIFIYMDTRRMYIKRIYIHGFKEDVY